MTALRAAFRILSLRRKFLPVVCAVLIVQSTVHKVKPTTTVDNPVTNTGFVSTTLTASNIYPTTTNVAGVKAERQKVLQWAHANGIPNTKTANSTNPCR